MILRKRIMCALALLQPLRALAHGLPWEEKTMWVQGALELGRVEGDQTIILVSGGAATLGQVASSAKIYSRGDQTFLRLGGSLRSDLIRLPTVELCITTYKSPVELLLFPNANGDPITVCVEGLAPDLAKLEGQMEKLCSRRDVLKRCPTVPEGLDSKKLMKKLKAICEQLVALRKQINQLKEGIRNGVKFKVCFPQTYAWCAHSSQPYVSLLGTGDFPSAHGEKLEKLLQGHEAMHLHVREYAVELRGSVVIRIRATHPCLIYQPIDTRLCRLLNEIEHVGK